VNLGTENKKKTIAAVVLIGFALVMLGYRIMFPAGTPPAAAVSPVNTTSAAPAQASPSPRPVARRTTGGKKQPLVASLDPTLRLWLLQSSENTAYTGNARNIFRAEAEPVIPKPIVNPVKQPTPPPVYTPPPPPPINLKFFGFASKPGEPKKVFLSQGEDVFIAGEGDIVDRRYKIVRITPMSVEVEDVLNNNRQSIPLTQG
jgi:hypothetical protein